MGTGFGKWATSLKHRQTTSQMASIADLETVPLPSLMPMSRYTCLAQVLTQTAVDPHKPPILRTSPRRLRAAGEAGIPRSRKAPYLAEHQVVTATRPLSTPT